MPLVPAKCTSCGANLNVDNSKDAAICPYCNNAYIVEKAIHNYQITNNNNIHADVVNIYGGNSGDFQIVAGMLMKYSGADCDVIIPNTITGINHHAFASYRNLTSVSIASGVEYIGSDAFFNCKSLTSVTLPQKLKCIESGTFWLCTSLTDVTIPEGVSSIGFFAFKDCVSLESIIIPDSVVKIGDGAFAGCSRLMNVKLPAHITNIDQAFSRTPWLTQYQADMWKNNGYCEYCGGQFKGIFSQVCKKCGKRKTY